MSDSAASTETATTTSTGRGRKVGIGLGVIVGLVLLYFLGGMVWLHKIDDDTSFGIDIEVPEEGSRAVAIAAALIDREINQNRWVANDPPFMPGALLDNMPNFQQGIIAGLSRFAVELTDQIARVRGSSQIDPDTDAAAGRLKYPGDVWIFEWSSAPVQPSSESQYRHAMQALDSYQARLVRGEAVFDRRADNLLETLNRIVSDLGSSSAAIYEKIDTSSGAWLDFTADDLFYANKGRLYAYYLLMRGLEHDFGDLLRSRDLLPAWLQMMTSLEAAASLQPFVVANGSLEGQMLPNHLAAQGFLLLRARTQMREVSNILLK